MCVGDTIICIAKTSWKWTMMKRGKSEELKRLFFRGIQGDKGI
jgi:hypothetical protein